MTGEGAGRRPVTRNEAAREGRYEAAIWTTLTGKPVEELADEWRKALAGQPDAGG